MKLGYYCYFVFFSHTVDEKKKAITIEWEFTNLPEIYNGYFLETSATGFYEIQKLGGNATTHRTVLEVVGK